MYSLYSSSSSRRSALHDVAIDKHSPSKVSTEAQRTMKNEHQEQLRKSRYRESLSELLNVLNDPTCCETFANADDSKPMQDDFIWRKSKDENFPPLVGTFNSVQVTPVTIQPNASREFKQPEVRRSRAYRCYPTRQICPNGVVDTRLTDASQFTKPIKSEASSRCSSVTNRRSLLGLSGKTKESIGNRFQQTVHNTDRDMVQREAFFSYPPEFIGIYADKDPSISLPSNSLDVSNESLDTAQGWTSSRSFSKGIVDNISAGSSIPKRSNYCSSRTTANNLNDEHGFLGSNGISNNDLCTHSTSEEANFFNDDDFIIPTRDTEKRGREDCGCHSCGNVSDTLESPVALRFEDRRAHQRTKPVISYSSPNTMIMQYAHNDDSRKRTINRKQTCLQQPRLTSNNEARDSPGAQNLKGNILPRYSFQNTRTPSWHAESSRYLLHNESLRLKREVIPEKFESDADAMSSSSVFESVSTISAFKPQSACTEKFRSRTEKKQAIRNSVHNHIYLSCIDAFSLSEQMKSSQYCLPVSKLICALEKERRCTLVKRHSTLQRARMSVRSKIRNRRRMLRKRKNAPLKFCRTSEILRISTRSSRQRKLCTLPINFVNFNTVGVQKGEKPKLAQTSVNVCNLLIEIETQLNSNKKLAEKLQIYTPNSDTDPTMDMMKLLSKAIRRCRNYVESHCNTKVAIEKMNEILLKPVLMLQGVANDEKATLNDSNRQSCFKMSASKNSGVQVFNDIASTLNNQKNRITMLVRTIFSLLNDFTPDVLEKKIIINSVVNKPSTPGSISKPRTPRLKNEKQNVPTKNKCSEIRTNQTFKPIHNDSTSSKLETPPKFTAPKTRFNDRSITENRVEIPDKKPNGTQRFEATKTAKKPVNKTRWSRECTLPPKVETNTHGTEWKMTIARSKPASNNPLPAWKPAGVSKLPVTISATMIQKHRPTPWSSGKDKVNNSSTEHAKSLPNKQINPSEPVASKPTTPKNFDKGIESREGRITRVCQFLAETKLQQRLKSGSTKDSSIEASIAKMANKSSETVLKKQRSNLKPRPGTPRNMKRGNEISIYNIKTSEKCDEQSQEAVTKLSKSTIVLAKREDDALEKVRIDRSSKFEEIRAKFSKMTLIRKSTSNTSISKLDDVKKTNADLQQEKSSSITNICRNTVDAMANTVIPYKSRSDLGTNTSLIDGSCTEERNSSFTAVSEVASSKCCQVSFASSTSVINISDDQLAQASKNVEEKASVNIYEHESEWETSQRLKKKSVNRHTLSLHALKEFLCDQGVSMELINKAEQDLLLRHQDRRKSVAKLSCSSQHIELGNDIFKPAISKTNLTHSKLEEEKNNIQEDVLIIPVIIHELSVDEKLGDENTVVKRENATSTKKNGNSTSSQTNRKWKRSSCSQTTAMSVREISTELDNFLFKADVGTEASVRRKSIDTMPETVLKQAREMQTQIVETRCKNSQTLNVDKRSVATDNKCIDPLNLSSHAIQETQRCPSKSSFSPCQSSIGSLSNYTMKNPAEPSSKESVTSCVPDELMTAFRAGAHRAQNVFAAIQIYNNTLASQTSLRENQIEIVKNCSPSTSLSKPCINSNSNTDERGSELSVNCLIHSSTGFRDSDTSEEELEFQDTGDVEWTGKQVALKPCNSVVLWEVESLMRFMLDRIKDTNDSVADYDIRKASDTNDRSDRPQHFQGIAQFHEGGVDWRTFSPSLTIFTRENLLHVIYGVICSIVFWCLQFSLTCEN